ncbi:MAG: alpha/beta hydrolase [Xenococcus sp. (in: cyanobacteria)]
MLRKKLHQFCLLMVGLGATITLGNSRAHATELIDLQYQDRSALVTIDDLSRFARSGIVPQSIQDLFETTDKVPSDISSILIKELKISQQFIDTLLESSIGEFILGRLDEVINESSSSADLNDVRSTLVAAYEDDNQISLIELIERYPQKELIINVTSLEGTYNQVVAIVDKVLPALETAKAYIQDVVCNCEEQATGLPQDGTEILTAHDNINCQNYISPQDQKLKSQDEILTEISARNSLVLGNNQ